MDLLAVKECTDERFLPARFVRLSAEEIEERIFNIKSLLGKLKF
jgi:hypothetical protein